MRIEFINGIILTRSNDTTPCSDTRSTFYIIFYTATQLKCLRTLTQHGTGTAALQLFTRRWHRNEISSLFWQKILKFIVISIPTPLLSYKYQKMGKINTNFLIMIHDSSCQIRLAASIAQWMILVDTCLRLFPFLTRQLYGRWSTMIRESIERDT